MKKKAVQQAEGKPCKGRYKDSKNTPKKEKETDNPSFHAFKNLRTKAIPTLKKTISGIQITHLVVDSAYAALHYLQKAEGMGCFLILKPNRNAAIYAIADKPDKPEKRRGRSQLYGKKFDLLNMPEQYLASQKGKNRMVHKVYQFQGINKSHGPTLLNFVVL